MEAIPSRIKRDFYIRLWSVMFSFDKDTLSQNTVKDSNSLPMYYLSTGLCGPLQLQIILAYCIEQGSPEEMILWSIVSSLLLSCVCFEHYSTKTEICVIFF